MYRILWPASAADNWVLLVEKKKQNLKIEICNKQERARLAGPEISVTCLFYSSRVTDICLQEILVAHAHGVKRHVSEMYGHPVFFA